MLKTFTILFITFVTLISCSKKEDKSKLKPTLSAMGMVVQVKYNPVTAQTEFTGAHLNWLGNTGTDYVVGLSPGAADVVEGSSINMTLPGYIPGTTTAFVPGSASLSRIFICPAGTTHYSRVVCSATPYCP
jgi:hypothetical protein